MNTEEIKSYVGRYCQATQCHIIESTPEHMTVKLSPMADKQLTNRSFYWSFVERTGAEPETMTYTFVFDPTTYDQKEEQRKLEKQKQQENKRNTPITEQATTPENDTILGRYLGITPSTMGGGVGTGPRKQYETLTFGSGRLQQIFQSTKQHGRYSLMFEQPHHTDMSLFAGYTPWFCLNMKVEFLCDMKRDELHSIGISLSTGEIVETFYDRIKDRQLTPQIPANTHVRETISLVRAVTEIEKFLEQKLLTYDHSWADEAQDRYMEESKRVETYYHELLKGCDLDEKVSIEEQFEQRTKETEWQHRPRIQVSVINCGIFQLLTDTFRQRNF